VLRLARAFTPAARAGRFAGRSSIGDPHRARLAPHARVLGGLHRGGLVPTDLPVGAGVVQAGVILEQHERANDRRRRRRSKIGQQIGQQDHDSAAREASLGSVGEHVFAR
jgi:hypothetical protein